MAHGHAVVIGGSVAGLTAARALSDHFEAITLVERDELPFEPAHRKGVPQARQLHACLPLGATLLDDFFPGFRSDLEEAGCPLFDEIRDTPWYSRYGWRARRTSDVHIYGFRRHVFEHVIRQRLREVPNVAITQGRVSGLLATPGGDRIVGVTIEHGATERLEAELVVDASGRGSKSPRWLSDLGMESPEEQHVRGFFGYATRFVTVDPDALPQGLSGVLTMPFPGRHRGGCFLPADDGLYTLCAIGAQKDYPPADEEGFQRYLRDAPSPLLAQMAELSEPVTEITTYHHPGNQRRLWERMRSRPRGFVPIGDAVASFNPVYGQGMTVAALQATKLAERLTELGDDLDALPDAFVADLAAVVEFPYGLATGADSGYAGTEFVNAAPPDPEAAGFFATVEQVASQDPDVARDILYAASWFRPELLGSESLIAKVQDWRDSGATVTNDDPSAVGPVLPSAAAEEAYR